MPAESIEPLAELFRHRFIETLLREKLISAKKARQLLGWKHSGFSLDAGEKPVASHDVEGRRRLAEYLLRAPFSLEKITWKKETGTVIYRSKRSWNTKRNFEVFSATDFIAAAVEHIPPKNQHTVRYYGLYSNKRHGMDAKARRPPPKLCCASASANASPAQPTPTILPPPTPKSTRALRPLWRDLIMRVWRARRSLGEGWGRRPTHLPLLQGDDESRRHHDTPGRGRVLPAPPRNVGVPFVALAKNGGHHRPAATAGSALRHRKTPRDRRRFGRRRSRSPQVLGDGEVCPGEPHYLATRVGCIHLNPVRAWLVSGVDDLGLISNPWSSLTSA